MKRKKGLKLIWSLVFIEVFEDFQLSLCLFKIFKKKAERKRTKFRPNNPKQDLNRCTRWAQRQLFTSPQMVIFTCGRAFNCISFEIFLN